MIDRIFGALLTFCLLAGGTAAIGSAMLERGRSADTQVVRLPTVTVIGKRSVEATTLARNEASEPRAVTLQ